MANLNAWCDELKARKARLREAEKYGWRDCIPRERETVAKFEFEFEKMLTENMDKICQLSGKLEVGESSVGMSFSYKSK